MDKDEEIYYWKSKYNNLVHEYNNLQEQYKELDKKLDKADYQIRTELEPRIAAEKRGYDCWVTFQAEPKCQCVIGCRYEDTDECLRKYEREENG